mmetsp:Transcript_117995/g.252014  ORF Transcript_117995/g.252014 Transcript_117995/m.252014 type:complete len:250 (-) Transcript_117995:76-825(-)
MSDGSDSEDEEVKATETLLWNVETGLPIMTDEKKKAAKTSGKYTVMVLLFAPRVLFTALACAIYWANKEDYDNRMLVWQHPSAAAYSLHLEYLYIAVGLFGVLSSFLNTFPMIYKGQVMPGSAGNLRANMLIYKVNWQTPDQKMPYVVLEESGEVGEYNRANRALHHFTENGTALGAVILLGGLIFPLPVMVLTIGYVVARIWYQIAYTTGGYGMGCCKHAVPFMIHSVIIVGTLEGLVWVAAFRLLSM